MKYRLIVILLLCIYSQKAFTQIYTPSYQSNKDLKFSSFLKGVSSAYIVWNEENLKYIIENPRSNIAYGNASLISYLKDIGFEEVNWGLSANKPTNFASNCELTQIYVNWSMRSSYLTDFKLNFQSCNGDVFTFSSGFNEFSVTTNTDLSGSFKEAFKKLYWYSKPIFSKDFSLKLPSEPTNWTEDGLKIRSISPTADDIEGIYQIAISTPTNSNYKLGLVKSLEGYHLIYLSGASNYNDWKVGEIKAKLYATATASIFKADYRYANKVVSSNNYITFEPGLMNFIASDNSKTQYIKLYPKSSDKLPPAVVAPLSGTGFAVSSNGFIVTNRSILQKATSIKVKGVNGDFSKSYRAKLIFEDKNNDLAIIKINDLSFANLQSIPFIIQQKTVDIGSSIFLLGYPENASSGDQIKLSSGIITSGAGIEGDITSYQVSASMESGNSGGPVFDKNRALIGVISTIKSGDKKQSSVVKAPYLLNVLKLIPETPILQKVSLLSSKTLTEQVKILKKFTYVIEVTR